MRVFEQCCTDHRHCNGDSQQSLPLGSYADGKYTGAAGGQASAEEVIWSLPNGLQAYAIFGAWAQRRVDAFTQIVRDPRIQRYVADKTNPT